ncbi:hypothetical protein BKA83DRAFT_4170183, partial [Pisolithus microcarpus]
MSNLIVISQTWYVARAGVSFLGPNPSGLLVLAWCIFAFRLTAVRHQGCVMLAPVECPVTPRIWMDRENVFFFVLSVLWFPMTLIRTPSAGLRVSQSHSRSLYM